MSTEVLTLEDFFFNKSSCFRNTTMCHASYSCSEQGISSQRHQLQQTESYAQYFSENQCEKPDVRKITWLFLYRLIWNHFFLLSFALKARRIRSVIKNVSWKEKQIFSGWKCPKYMQEGLQTAIGLGVEENISACRANVLKRTEKLSNLKNVLFLNTN